LSSIPTLYFCERWLINLHLKYHMIIIILIRQIPFLYLDYQDWRCMFISIHTLSIVIWNDVLLCLMFMYYHILVLCSLKRFINRLWIQMPTITLFTCVPCYFIFNNISFKFIDNYLPTLVIEDFHLKLSWEKKSICIRSPLYVNPSFHLAHVALSFLFYIWTSLAMLNTWPCKNIFDIQV
jgi:hypothetical protein